MVFYFISGDTFCNLITADVEKDGGEDEDVSEDGVYFHFSIKYQVSSIKTRRFWL